MIQLNLGVMPIKTLSHNACLLLFRNLYPTAFKFIYHIKI